MTRYGRWLTAVASVALAPVAMAQTATQVVTFRVNAVNQIAVSGTPGPLAITTAVAGNGPTAAEASGTTYAITTNQSNQKITASINEAMPSGTTLEISLGAPAGAVSAGAVPLGTAGADVVTGISATTATALPIVYRLSATAQTRLGATSRTVTFTVVSGT